MKHWWMDTVTVSVDTDDVIEHIPFEKLEEEYKRRVELKENDPEQFAKEERYNTQDVDIEICPDDYDLVKKDEVTLDEFGVSEIMCYLEQQGYRVFDKGYICGTDADVVSKFLDEQPKYKKIEFICDVLGLGHFCTIEDILNTLKERL